MKLNQFQLKATILGTAGVVSFATIAAFGYGSRDPGSSCISASAPSTIQYFATGRAYNNSTTAAQTVICSPGQGPTGPINSYTATVYTVQSGQTCTLYVSDYGSGNYVTFANGTSAFDGYNVSMSMTASGYVGYPMVTLACPLAAKSGLLYFGIQSFLLSST